MEHAVIHHANHSDGHHGMRHRLHVMKRHPADLPVACVVLAIALVLLWVLVELAVVGGYALVYRVDDLMAALYMRANPISMNFIIVSFVLVVISPLIAMNFYQGKK